MCFGFALCPKRLRVADHECESTSCVIGLGIIAKDVRKIPRSQAIESNSKVPYGVNEARSGKV